LKPSRRYGHADGYIAALAAQAGFTVAQVTAEVLRRDGGADVDGKIYLLVRSALGQVLVDK
jgi:predicted TPR repeat methyltransferase